MIRYNVCRGVEAGAIVGAGILLNNRYYMQSAIGNFDQAGARINADSTVPFPDMALTVVIPLGYALPAGLDAQTISDMCLLLCAMIKNGANPYELQQRIMGLS